MLPDLEPVIAKALVELVGARYPVSRNYQILKKNCPELVFEKESKEWVFFGGSFNPWHSGHQACLNLLPQDKTCFILPDINPHKELRDFDLVSSVLELSSKARFSSNQFLVPSFLVDNVKNPTVVWIEKLHQNFPDKKLSLLIGFDSFSNIFTWTRAQDLLSNLHCLYVVSRQETDDMKKETVLKIQKIAPDLEIVFLGRHEHEEISSSKIRKKKGG